MVDRYKKPGGFVQLVQVIETCNAKKREQFMNIIAEENPEWAEALTQKSISFDKIVSWSPEVILEIMASVNQLAFSVALKSLAPEHLETFIQKLSPQDRRKIEMTLQEMNPTPNEIGASVMKVISETRGLLVQGSIKAEKIDPQLVIPDEFEAKLGKSARLEAAALSFEGPSTVVSTAANGAVATAEIEKLQKRLILLSKEVQILKNENQVMKDKLEKIKKIA
ncbi:FliG C-terminal domain-containing protein [Pseudobdellovibrio exovorus]|nr:FliG C-terminal domain-containing protein [Pseudobdellovibrio exovorus]